MQCSHDGQCPLEKAEKYCHFVQRLERTSIQRTFKVLPCINFLHSFFLKYLVHYDLSKCFNIDITFSYLNFYSVPRVVSRYVALKMRNLASLLSDEDKDHS